MDNSAKIGSTIPKDVIENLLKQYGEITEILSEGIERFHPNINFEIPNIGSSISDILKESFIIGNKMSDSLKQIHSEMKKIIEKLDHLDDAIRFLEKISDALSDIADKQRSFF